MKKNYLLLVIAASLLSVSNVCAQKIKYGAKLGLDLSTFYGKDIDEYSNAGAYMGGFIGSQISDKIGVQLESLYTEVGALNDDNSEQNVKLSYITIPLTCNYSLSKKGIIEFGPVFWYNVDADIKNRDNSIFNKNVTSEDVKAFGFGLIIGAEVFSNEFCGFSIRYNIGLTNIIKDSNIRNSAIQIGLVYRI